ncbi:hypothetical protein C0T31_04260 [Dysgonamonadaceae bacterium]|nr:hypothetical protein C0T31_04260 [Dysgonamonadaceae bacterium]
MDIAGITGWVSSEYQIKISDTLTVIENNTAYMKSESLPAIGQEIQKEARSKVKTIFNTETHI